MENNSTKRKKYVSLVIAFLLLSSIGFYVSYQLEQSYEKQKENLQAVFYEQGLPDGTDWSVTIHPYGSPSNTETLTTISSKIVFSGLKAATYDYSFSPMKGDTILSYGGNNTGYGLVGTQNGLIWVGASIIPIQPSKPVVVRTVYTLGIYYPEVEAHNVGVYFDNNGTVYNLTRTGNSIVYETSTPYTYIVSTTLDGIVTGSEYRINWVGTNASANYNNIPTNPDPPFVNSVSSNLIFTINVTVFPQERYYRVYLSGY
jgi:hypothetical protein